ncbi:VGR-related protein, partial [Pluralibacter gergoviae]
MQKDTAFPGGNIPLSRYRLDINDSSVVPDVLRFRGRDALSEPFRWEIE